MIHIYSSDTHFVAESIPPSLHSNHPTALFVYCIRAYRICAPSVPAALAIVPYAYSLVCSSHQHYSYNVEILAQSTHSTYHAFRSIRHQFKFKWTPSPSLPHVVHLVSLLDSQIRGCRASGVYWDLSLAPVT